MDHVGILAGDEVIIFGVLIKLEENFLLIIAEQFRLRHEIFLRGP